MSAFRRRNAAIVAARHFGPDMTPMVDIVMVILIFFMAGSAFIGPEWFLEVGMARGVQTTPTTEPANTLQLPAPRMVVRLARSADGAGVVTGLGLEAAPIEALEARLAEYVAAGAAPGMRLVVEPAHDVPYQDVIRVYDLCRRAGVEEVTLAKSPGPAG